jgi:hypothetical protein
MKRKLLICVAALMLVAGFSMPLWAEMTGRQIMEKQEELHKVTTEYGEETMILVDRKKNKTIRKIKRYSKDFGNDLSKFLLVFLEPKDVRGTALLTWNKKGGKADQWLYMPATKKLQRIAKGSKKQYFMGTDFTYEDMEPEDVDNYKYTVARSETVKVSKKDYECWVIEAVPANKDVKRKSGYAKRIMWISKDNFLTLKVEFFDRRKRLLKKQAIYDPKNVAGTVYRPKKTVMTRKKPKHQTATLTIMSSRNGLLKPENM